MCLCNGEQEGGGIGKLGSAPVIEAGEGVRSEAVAQGFEQKGRGAC